MEILQFQTMKALAVNFCNYCSHDFMIAEQVELLHFDSGQVYTLNLQESF